MHCIYANSFQVLGAFGRILDIFERKFGLVIATTSSNSRKFHALAASVNAVRILSVQDGEAATTLTVYKSLFIRCLMTWYDTSPLEGYKSDYIRVHVYTSGISGACKLYTRLNTMCVRNRTFYRRKICEAENLSIRAWSRTLSTCISDHREIYIHKNRAV